MKPAELFYTPCAIPAILLSTGYYYLPTNIHILF